jgi:2-keto-3-deoxy-L-fuconate dehydrogenase
MFSLTGKTAIVTGGGSGIGKAISALFAAQGAKVYIIERDEKGSANAVSEILKNGHKAFFQLCDITNPVEVNRIIAEILAESSINIVVNNAGIALVGNAEQTTAADFDKLISVNIKGVFHILQATLPHLKINGGVILNMASVAAWVGIADRFAYSMTKAAMTGMTLSIAKDYIKYGIRCNCISPARVHTPFVDGFVSKNYPGKEEEVLQKLSASQPIGRMAQPEEIAHLALYLCSDEASFITGSDYPIDGGFTRLNN